MIARQGLAVTAGEPRVPLDRARITVFRDIMFLAAGPASGRAAEVGIPMLSPKDFVARWGKKDPLIRFRKQALARLVIADADKDFLAQAGLPESAAPFLGFEAPKSGELPTVADQWHQPERFRRYRVIGSDGAGNPIALDEERAGEVVRLDHEEGFARTLMNKTVRQLAESLLVYWNVAGDSLAADDADALELPAKVRKQLHQALKRIDPAAMKVGCFWPEETKVSDASADYPAKVLRDLRSPDASVRLKASKHLESELRKGATKQRIQWFGNKKATSPIIAALDDPDPKVVHNAVVALACIASHFKDDRAYARLLQLIRSKHPLTQRWVIFALIDLRGEASLDDVLPLCKDRSKEAREATLNGLLGWLRGMKTNRAGAIRPETRERLQAAALRALGDRQSDVRAPAAELLGEVGDATALAALRVRLKKERQWDAKQCISEAIEQVEGRL